MVESPTSNGSDRRGVRCNSMWSLWYGAIGGIMLAYLVARSARRYLGYMSLSWPPEPPPREWELHLSIAGTALAAVLIPPFLAASFFKIGNLANDGYKLGWDSECQSSEDNASVWSLMWKHAGPTAPAVHVLAALCLLLPKLLLEARLLEAGFLPKESALKTDLSYLSPQHLLPPPTQRPVVNNTRRTTTETTLLHVHIFEALDPSIWSSAFSAEFLQYAAALLVFSSRHAAVFWRCGLRFSLGFALQQACVVIQSCLLLSVCALLYKHASLPAEVPSFLTATLSTAPVMLGRGAVLLLTITSLMFLMSSGTALYVHGLNRLDDVVRKKRECSAVTYRRMSSRTCSSCGSICYLIILLSLGSCLTPLLNSVVYIHCPATPNFPNALSILSMVLLITWFPLWLWVRNSPLHFGAGDALLQAYRHYGAGDAVLVLGGKRAYTVTGAEAKAAIMAVVKDSTHSGVRDSTDDLLGGGQVYWLRETNEAPRRDRKISFGDTVCNEDTSERTAAVLFEEVDDGDYATLMKLPSPPPELMDPEDRRDTSESTLRRTDSGVPHDEITPCSDSEDNTEPPPPDTSEGSSSGITSAASSVCKPGLLSAPGTITSSDLMPAGTSGIIPPAVEPATVVIRRKPHAVRVQSVAGILPTEEPFGRSTNMRMTSFAEGRVRTLPYFPAQRPTPAAQHCSTMPAQPHTSHVLSQAEPRIAQVPQVHSLHAASLVPPGHRSFSPRLLQYECRLEQQPYRTPAGRASQPPCISEHV